MAAILNCVCVCVCLHTFTHIRQTYIHIFTHTLTHSRTCSHTHKRVYEMTTGCHEAPPPRTTTTMVSLFQSIASSSSRCPSEFNQYSDAERHIARRSAVVGLCSSAYAHARTAHPSPVVGNIKAAARCRGAVGRTDIAHDYCNSSTPNDSLDVGSVSAMRSFSVFLRRSVLSFR